METVDYINLPQYSNKNSSNNRSLVLNKWFSTSKNDLSKDLENSSTTNENSLDDLEKDYYSQVLNNVMPLQILRVNEISPDLE